MADTAPPGRSGVRRSKSGVSTLFRKIFTHTAPTKQTPSTAAPPAPRSRSSTAPNLNNPVRPHSPKSSSSLSADHPEDERELNIDDNPEIRRSFLPVNPQRATSWSPDDHRHAEAEDASANMKSRSFFSGTRMKSFGLRKKNRMNRHTNLPRVNTAGIGGFDFLRSKPATTPTSTTPSDHHVLSRASLRFSQETMPTALDAGLVVGICPEEVDPAGCTLNSQGEVVDRPKDVAEHLTPPSPAAGSSKPGSQTISTPPVSNDVSPRSSRRSLPSHSSASDRPLRPASKPKTNTRESVGKASTAATAAASVAYYTGPAATTFRDSAIPKSQASRSQPNMSVCPFGHGTAVEIPGRPPPGPICPRSCIPMTPEEAATPKSTGSSRDSKRERRRRTMMREALEFQQRFQAAECSSPESAAARMEEVAESVLSKGIYEHTIAEIEFGARLAWRNSARCPARQLCDVPTSLRVLDHRAITTSQEMQARCIVHMELVSVLRSQATACISVFPPLTRQGKRGPRIWNSKLVDYAGYLNPDGTVLGNKDQVAFTGMCMDRLGWSPNGERTAFDLLPVVIQIDASEPPVLLDISDTLAPQISLSHPDYPVLARAQLKCPAMPCFSSFNLEIGGIVYPVVLSRWPTDDEVATAFCDERSLWLPGNVTSALERRLSSVSGSFESRLVKILSEAAIHSFEKGGSGIAHEESVLDEYIDWILQEKNERGYVTVDKEWIKARAARLPNPERYTDFLLKPCFRSTPDWLEYLYPRLS